MWGSIAFPLLLVLAFIATVFAIGRAIGTQFDLQERTEARDDLKRVRHERDQAQLRALNAEQRAHDAERRADKAEVIAREAERRASDAAKAIQNGALLFEKIDEMQAEIVRLRDELTRATLKIAELQREVEKQAQQQQNGHA